MSGGIDPAAVTPIGYQGAAARTWTAGCDGSHPIAERCPASKPQPSVNYIDAIVARLDEKIPGNDPALLRLYALLALTQGVNTTLENVHDAWAAWRTATNRAHKSLVPFGELSVEVQEYDRKYMDAIHEVSAQ